MLRISKLLKNKAREIEMGISDELEEHGQVLGDRDPKTVTTKDLKDAKHVAEDHLKKHPGYYTKLKKVGL